MPWRRPRKKVERPIEVTRSIEESLEDAATGEEEEDSVDLAELDDATIVEAATGEPEPERGASDLALKLRERLAREPAAARARPRATTYPESGGDLAVDAARGLRLRNPVLTAPGTFGQGVEYAELIDVSRLGAIVNKGTTPTCGLATRSTGSPRPHRGS